MVVVTPSIVLVLTTVTMLPNAGPTALLPIGSNDRTIMYAFPCPKLNGQLNFSLIFSPAYTDHLQQGLHIPASHTIPHLLDSGSSVSLVWGTITVTLTNMVVVSTIEGGA
jgi:hypothetical protein